MASLLKLAFVGGVVALVGIGSLNVGAHLFADAALDGVEPPAAAPRLSLRAVRDETFQTRFTAWYEQHWGLRGYVARTDNTLNRFVFGDAKQSATVIIGRDGVLFPIEDINYVNRSEPPSSDTEAAGRIARVQHVLAERGIAVVPVVIPAKTTAYRAAVPEKWRRAGAFGSSDDSVYRAYVGALAAAGVRFVDARRMEEEQAGPPSAFFPATGRHWRKSFACAVLRAAVVAAGLDGSAIDCHVHLEPHPPRDGEEFDEFRLLDTWESPPTGLASEWFDRKVDLPALRVPTLFVGSSFVWQFLTVTRELDVLQPSLFYYYDASIVDGRTNATIGEVQPQTQAWREATFSKRLIVVGMLESYLPGDGDKFFKEVEAASAD